MATLSPVVRRMANEVHTKLGMPLADARSAIGRLYDTTGNGTSPHWRVVTEVHDAMLRGDYADIGAILMRAGFSAQSIHESFTSAVRT